MESFKIINTTGLEDKLKELGYKPAKSGMYGAYAYTVGKSYNITPSSHFWHSMELPLYEIKDDKIIKAVTNIEYNTERASTDDETIADFIIRSINNAESNIAKDLKTFIPKGAWLSVSVKVVR